MISFSFVMSLVLIVTISYIFIQFNISTVLGYLLAGMIIGENGLQYFASTDDLLFTLSELGVVFLLFVIGLELSYKRIAVMKKYIFILGASQFFITSSILFWLLYSYFNSFVISFILGSGLAISSTSVVLQVLKEKEMQGDQIGKISLGVLLFQDMVVVPILVILPLLKEVDMNFWTLNYSIVLSLIKGLVALGFIFLLSRILHPLVKSVTYSRVSVNNEIFTLVVFVIIFSAVFVSDQLGLQLTLGGFIAGVLLSEHEFKYHVEKSIITFKNILLGLFFLSVGMKINIGIVYHNVVLIFVSSLSLMLLKGIILFLLIWGVMKYTKQVAFKSAVLLSQGSEFGFVIFNKALADGMLSSDLEEILLTFIVISMAFTPIVFNLARHISKYIWKYKNALSTIEQNAHDISDHVIVLGYGYTGKMVVKYLSSHEIDCIVLDSDVNVVKKYQDCIRINKANGANIEAMMAAGLLRAKALVVTFENNITIERLLLLIQNMETEKNFSTIVRSQKATFKKKFIQLGADEVILDEVESGKELADTVLNKFDINKITMSDEHGEVDESIK